MAADANTPTVNSTSPSVAPPVTLDRIDPKLAPMAAAQQQFDDYARTTISPAAPAAEVPPAAVTPPTAATITEKPRDPETGKFVPAERPAHDAYDVMVGKHFGLTSADLDGMTPHQLRQWVGEVQQRVVAAPAAPSPAATPTTTPATTPAPAVSQQWSIDWGQSDSGKPHSEKDWEDSPAFAPLKSLAERSKAQDAKIAEQDAKIAELTDQLKKVGGYVAARQQKETNLTLDGFFAKYPEHFGKGSRDELGADSREMEVRMDAIAAMKRYNLPLDQAAAKYARLHNLEKPAPAPAPTPAAKPPVDDAARRQAIADWNSQSLATPTPRIEPSDVGREAAIRKLDEMRREHGLTEADLEKNGRY